MPPIDVDELVYIEYFDVWAYHLRVVFRFNPLNESVPVITPKNASKSNGNPPKYITPEIFYDQTLV